MFFHHLILLALGTAGPIAAATPLAAPPAVYATNLAHPTPETELLPLAQPAPRARPYREDQRRDSWFASLFLRPAHADASNQLAHARALRDAGRPRGAARAYRALVNTWPAAPEAVTALLERARLLEERGQWEDAFADYQQLVSRYAGRFDFNEVIARQIRIADRIADRRSMRWLLGGFSTPERALPLYAQILTNAPTSPGAPAVALRIARIHEQNGDLAEAVAAYADVRIRYPDAPEAEEAAARRIGCLMRMARRAPNHTAVLDEAWSSILDFLRRYPRSAQTPLIETYRSEVAQRRARIAFESARMYDRARYSNNVIRTAYERFLAQFPDSPWSPTARRRIAELEGHPEADR
ncbi:MAG: tetratricopeptide repeat protein [Kiritimatiellae bacterium]|nr:tetratricopeptide repeat protein [Kiritimatiellia bacterium]